jgi:CHAT domain-containing protein
MAQEPNDRSTIREYLLGRLPDSQRQDFEQRLISDDTALEELLMGEDELIDAYLRGELDADQKRMFESFFLATSERQDKLRFSRAFMNYVSTQIADGPVAQIERGGPLWWAHLFNSPMRIGVSALVIVAVALATWQLILRQSDVDKGLVALNDAYREQRPIEARISQLDYAPFSVTRGAEPERVNSVARDRAERILLDAVAENPTPAAHHALGKLYLANKNFDKSIEQFEQALNADPKNSQIYADLGAAWLEKGKISLDKGRANPSSPELGKGMEELGRSLENLNKALENNPSLEALFNRALAEQYMTLYEQAEQDWREYLKRDSTSLWADEARRNLKKLEERKAKTSGTKKQLIEDFLRAYEAQNDDAAWAAMSLSRARTGNGIVEALLDDLLSLEANGRQTDAKIKQQMLLYAGSVEFKRVQDRFTQNLARGYESATTAQRATRAQARGLMKSAITVYNKAEYQQAIALFSDARQAFAQTDDEVETLFAEAWVGYCHLRIPHPQKGIQIFERLSRVFKAKNYRSLFAQSLLALADAMNGRSEFSRVLELANQALAISEQIQDQANAIRCLQAGTTMQLILGNYRESLAATFRALGKAEALPPDAKLTWPFYHEAALDFYSLGLTTSALMFENEALRLAINSGLSLHASRSYDRLGLIFEGLHNYTDAIQNIEQSRSEGLKIADEQPRTNILAHSAMNFGRLYRQTGDLQRAVDFYDQALELFNALNLNIYQYEARKGKLLALIQLNNDVAAEAELATVLYWFEKNRETIAEESYRNKFFDKDQNTYDVAVDFHYSRKKDVAKAFEYAEAYRARSLLDLMSTGAQITSDKNNPELKLSLPTSPLTLAQIQPQLPKQTQLLEYAVLDDKVLMWVVTTDNVKSAQTSIRRDELDEKIRAYLRALSRTEGNRNDEIIRQGKALYAILIDPVESYLDRSVLLCIVPDDMLSFLPFAALVSPTSGRYLVEDFTLGTAPSATIFINASRQPEQRTRNNSERLLIVGNPHFDREQFVNLPDLPGAKREAEEIANLYATSPLVGNAATSSRVKQLLKEAHVVHFATHAVPDESSPLLSKLVFSKDGLRDRETHHISSGVLQASEIYAMKLPRTRLVVLSACQTGIERAYQGEGAIGLARPFIAAGVPVVIASLWPVESEATADLMISFHKHRKRDDVSSAEALRLAQLEMLHNKQPDSVKNYGWAAFTAIGGYASF